MGSDGQRRSKSLMGENRFEDKSLLRLIVILSDGIRGHLNQSRGVAFWLSRGTGAEILEAAVPTLHGLGRVWAKIAARRLKSGTPRDAQKWLDRADGESLACLVEKAFDDRGIRGYGEVLFLSAGTLPALFSLALGHVWGFPCAALMTPGGLGTAPFDFAVVPEHDHPADAPNVLTTLGAPNSVVGEDLESAAQTLLRDFPSEHEKKWGGLIGGDDNNYRAPPKWVRARLGRLFETAVEEKADLYVSTSRRTPKDTEEAIVTLSSGQASSFVKFLLLASKDPSNPVPGILGACDTVFCTDDSVNMVSEAVTAGHRVVLMAVERAGILRPFSQRATAVLVKKKFLPRSAIWGVPRFEATYERFEEECRLVRMENWQRTSSVREAPARGLEFNEARRAADWISKRLACV